jgi:ligand-binding sensor domain-containing protein
MRPRPDKFVTVFILLHVFFIRQSPAAYYPPVSYPGIEQGLSNNAVRCIYQDHMGFMWFGTYDGLVEVRFDKQPAAGVYMVKVNDAAPVKLIVL